MGLRDGEGGGGASAASAAPRLGDRFQQGEAAQADAEELRLVARLKAGDQSAFAPIYERHKKHVYAYAMYFVDDAAEAEDITQELFLRMLEALPRYEITDVPFRIWLFRVLRNIVLKRIHARDRLVVESPDEMRERIEEEQRRAERHPIEEELFARLSDARFVERISELPFNQRRVLVLRFVLGLKTGEAARFLGINGNAAANLLYRALTALRLDLDLESKGALSRDRVQLVERPRFSPVIWGRRLVAVLPRASRLTDGSPRS